MVFWLVLVTANMTLHVGNFPDQKTCDVAASAAMSQAYKTTGKLLQGGVLCVQASVQNGPPAPQ